MMQLDEEVEVMQHTILTLQRQLKAYKDKEGRNVDLEQKDDTIAQNYNSETIPPPS